MVVAGSDPLKRKMLTDFTLSNVIEFKIKACEVFAQPVRVVGALLIQPGMCKQGSICPACRWVLSASANDRRQLRHIKAIQACRSIGDQDLFDKGIGCFPDVCYTPKIISSPDFAIDNICCDAPVRRKRAIRVTEVDKSRKLALQMARVHSSGALAGRV